MHDPIYELYLVDGEVRKKILRSLRQMVRQTGLDKHNVNVRPAGSQKDDDVEARADLFAKEMRDRPEIQLLLQGSEKVIRLAEIDLKSFETTNGSTKTLAGKRATEAILGKRRIMPGKARKNRNEEQREKNVRKRFSVVKNEVTSGKGYSLPLVDKNTTPIDTAKPIRKVTGKDIRPVLDLEGCDGITALKVLTMVVFAKQSYELRRTTSPSRPQQDNGDQGSRQMQINLGKLEC